MSAYNKTHLVSMKKCWNYFWDARTLCIYQRQWAITAVFVVGEILEVIINSSIILTNGVDRVHQKCLYNSAGKPSGAGVLLLRAVGLSNTLT